MKKFKEMKNRYKILIIAALSVILLAILYLGFVDHLFYSHSEEIIKISPDGNKQLIIREFEGLIGAHGADVYICANSRSAFWNRLSRIKVGTVSGIAHSKTGIYGSWAGDQHVKVGFLADGRRESKTFTVPALFRN